MISLTPEGVRTAERAVRANADAHEAVFAEASATSVDAATRALREVDIGTAPPRALYGPDGTPAGPEAAARGGVGWRAGPGPARCGGEPRTAVGPGLRDARALAGERPPGPGRPRPGA